MSGVSKEEYIAATTYIINMLSKFAITTNQIYYDTRFDSECVLGCKPMFSEINTTIASAIALINLHEDVQDSFDDYFAMISNNVRNIC